MRNRFVVSAKFGQNHSEIAMDCGLLRFELERCLILADRFLITTHRFFRDCGSRLAQTLCGDGQRVCEIGPDCCDSGAPGGGRLRLFQLQRLAILGDSFVKSLQPAISQAKLVMNIGQLRLQFRRATGMVSGLRVPFLLEAALCDLNVSLPRIGIFGEIILPKPLFIAINFRSAEGVCSHCANQQRNNGGSGNFSWLSLVPHVCYARAEKCKQGNVRKILVMIGDERATADVGHSNESERRKKGDDEAGNRKKSAACPTIPPMPEASQDGDKANQRQPFQNARRIESPVWVNRHQSDRGEEMPSVPPYCHCGVYQAAR